MNEPTRRLELEKGAPDYEESLLTTEWLVTNGLGGYASGTISGAVTRRYHGLLIAAIPDIGRIMMFNHLSEHLIEPDGSSFRLSGDDEVQTNRPLTGAQHLIEFRLEAGLPVWLYQTGESVLEKRIVMPYQQNTVHIRYRLLSGHRPVRMELYPSFHFRPHKHRVDEPLAGDYDFTIIGKRYEIAASRALPVLRMVFQGERTALTIGESNIREIMYRVEAAHGYDSRGMLWNPGYFRTYLIPGRPATLIASTEPWSTIMAIAPDESFALENKRRSVLLSRVHSAGHQQLVAELVLAADQFVINPAERAQETCRARAAGDEVRTVIAGYHWFTDWGRDTMISLEGLTLVTGRWEEAGRILRTFATYVRNGLIPNLFPEEGTQGLYHTADATLWYFHAIGRYVSTTRDRTTLRMLLPILREIIDQHVRGTVFGIRLDPADGLLTQGQEGFALTWMDAKVDNWVVTPRRGKAVEINALWYNALRYLQTWSEEEGQESRARELGLLADRAQQSFNRRFWFDEGQYLLDIVDGREGDDHACRPNQILAISLDHPVLEPSRWNPVMASVRDRLLTAKGLRSLSPENPDYKSRYFGDVRARDAAYHQGTVWAWLIGPFYDAWRKVHPDDDEGARALLSGFEAHLGEGCVGSISEIFDAEHPLTPRGCIAQAWSVAEVLRCLVTAAPAKQEG